VQLNKFWYTAMVNYLLSFHFSSGKSVYAKYYLLYYCGLPIKIRINL